MFSLYLIKVMSGITPVESIRYKVNLRITLISVPRLKLNTVNTIFLIAFNKNKVLILLYLPFGKCNTQRVHLIDIIVTEG